MIDLETKKVENTIKMELDGPNGLGNPLGIYVLNPDSIYVPNMSFELNLINSQGNWLSDHNYSPYSLFGDVAASMTR